MEYSKDFKSLLNVDLPDGYIGHGNPNAKILILGQEPAHDKDSAAYNLEIAGNKHQWQNLVEKGTGYESVNPAVIQFGSPLWPWANQTFMVRSEVRNDEGQAIKVKGEEGTAKTWYNYQKLIDRIFNKKTVRGGILDFHKLSFHTDMSAEASKQHDGIDVANAKESVEKRAKELFSQPFFHNFPVVIAPVGHFPRDSYGDAYFNKAFDVSYCPNEDRDWININVREDVKHPQILIHCKQIAYVSDRYLEKIAEIVRTFAEEHNIQLLPQI